MDTPEFKRLHNLRQFRLYLIYPSANHTRFEHSLGVSFSQNISYCLLKINQNRITDRLN